MLTQGEEDLTTFDDINVWIAPVLPSDRPELVQGGDPILRQEFDEVRPAWDTPVNYCTPSNPCQNGGVCSSDPLNTKTFKCRCPTMFTGLTCQTAFVASQKTTLSGSTGAKNAIDNNANTMSLNAGTTEGILNPWWKLDMQEEMRVRMVRLFTYENEDYFLDGAKVLVGNVDNVWDNNNIQCGTTVTRARPEHIKIFDGECSNGVEICMYEGSSTNAEGTVTPRDDPGTDAASRAKACSDACLDRKIALSGSWSGFFAKGFVVDPTTGRCYCESADSATCTRDVNHWDRYDWDWSGTPVVRHLDCQSAEGGEIRGRFLWLRLEKGLFTVARFR